MSASVIYYWRRGVLTLAAGQIFHVQTHQTQSRIDDWQKVQERRVGKVTLWDHCFERALPGGGTVVYRIGIEASGTEKMATYDFPGYYAQRFDGVDRGEGSDSHRHSGAAVYVGGKRFETYVHGWPPCNLPMCVVVMQQWAELFAAIAKEKELSSSIQP